MRRNRHTARYRCRNGSFPRSPSVSRLGGSAQEHAATWFSTRFIGRVRTACVAGEPGRRVRGRPKTPALPPTVYTHGYSLRNNSLRSALVNTPLRRTGRKGSLAMPLQGTADGISIVIGVPILRVRRASRYGSRSRRGIADSARTPGKTMPDEIGARVAVQEDPGVISGQERVERCKGRSTLAPCVSHGRVNVTCARNLDFHPCASAPNTCCSAGAAYPQMRRTGRAQQEARLLRATAA
jgi:hypothetical protein